MEERNYINYIYRVKQLCPLQKKDPLKNKTKNFSFLETKSIVKYLFPDCYVFILAESMSATFIF